MQNENLAGVMEKLLNSALITAFHTHMRILLNSFTFWNPHQVTWQEYWLTYRPRRAVVPDRHRVGFGVHTPKRYEKTAALRKQNRSEMGDPSLPQYFNTTPRHSLDLVAINSYASAACTNGNS